MNVKTQAGRWAVGPSDFAARITLPDLKGFFDSLPLLSSFPKSRTLVIEPGTRALIIDDGLLIGQFNAGTYTLESFVERLQFWRNKQATVFLTRSEDVPIESGIRGVPCADNICFDLKYRWTIQIADSLPFMNNLMGARNELSVGELTRLLEPLVQQATYATVGNCTYDQVRRPDFAAYLQQGVKPQVDVKLNRYGLTFVDIQNVTLTSEADEIEDRKGELFQRNRQQQFVQAVNELENEELKSRLSDFRTKTDVRNQLRRVVADDKLNALSSKNDFEKALLEIDKDKLLRAEERESLMEAFTDRKEDREGQRAHLLATLDLQRERELDEMRMQMEHVMQQKGLAQEIELAKLSRGEEAEQWRHELLQEKEQLGHRLAQKQSVMQAKWDRIRHARQQSRSDAWEALLHDQKMEEIRADLEVAKAERGRKVALLQSELNARLASDKLEIEKRQQQWELEHKEQRSESQLNRLQRIQEMNAQFAQQQQRMQVEMENLKADGESNRELNRIQAMSGLSTEALIALAGSTNAAALADLKKHEATQDAVKAHASSQPAAELNAERLRLYEKLNETERAKADALAEAYKMAMQAQQASVNQMIGGLTQASSAASHMHTPPAMFGSPMAPPPMPAAVQWYVSINGQQSPPLQWAQLQQYIQMGQVNSSTMVWKAGMPSWLPAAQVPELAPYLSPSAGPPPMPGCFGPPGPPPM